MKTVLITGASSGIGKAVAERFIDNGDSVINFDVTQPDYDVTYNEVDISSEESIVNALINIESLDVVVNAAGIYFLKDVTETTSDELDKIVDINFKGTYLMCKHTLPLLVESKGTIINIASTLGAVPEPSSPAYCSTKAATIMLTKCLSQQYGKDGVRVNAVLPGPIDTPLLRASFNTEEDMQASAQKNPMRRIGTPEDVTNVVFFLASEEAGFVNGAEYAVDGGESASSVYTT